MSFREVIQKELDRRGWSGYRLGKESGVPIRTIQKYLAGDSDMTGERLAALCKTLELELKPKKRMGR